MKMVHGYLDEVFEILKITKAKPVEVPGRTTSVIKEKSDALDGHYHRRFRRCVGKLQWISPFRPDVSYSVKELARSLTQPTEEDWPDKEH